METAGDPEALKREILEMARRDGEGIIAAAEAEAETVLAGARTEAAGALREKTAAAEAAVARMRALMRAAVPAEAGRERAALQEELLESIKAIAADKLAANADRSRAAASLAAQAMGCMEGDSFVVTVEPADNRPELAAEVAGLCPRPVKVAVEEGSLPGGGGAVVRSADGRQRWDNSFGARLERAWPWLRGRLLPPEAR